MKLQHSLSFLPVQCKAKNKQITMRFISLTSLLHTLFLPHHLIQGNWRRSQDYYSYTNLQNHSETGVIDWMGKPTFSTLCTRTSVWPSVSSSPWSKAILLISLKTLVQKTIKKKQQNDSILDPKSMSPS